MAKRKVKTAKPLSWGPLVWLLVIVSCVSGLAFSPATAVRRVRIEGASGSQVAAVEDAVRSIRGIPFVRCRFHDVEGRIERRADIARAEVVANIFGRMIVRVYPRKPIAKIADNVVVAADGVVFRSVEASANLPKLVLRANRMFPATGLIGTWNASGFVELCKQLESAMPGKSWTISENRDLGVSLKGEEAATINLGSLEKLDAKTTQLRRILIQKPQLLSEVKEINLSSPENPVYRP